MWDHHDFTSKAEQCPIRYSFKNKFTFTGRFCSPECALAWGELGYGIGSVKRQCALWMKKIHGRFITRAAPHVFLQAYGGPLTIEQFRKSNMERSLHFELLRPSPRHIPIAWELYQPLDRKNSTITSIDAPMQLIITDKSIPLENFTSRPDSVQKHLPSPSTSSTGTSSLGGGGGPIRRTKEERRKAISSMYKPTNRSSGASRSGRNK